MENLPTRPRAVRRLLSKSLGPGIALALAAAPALGWGPEGHRIIAMIAQMNLTPQARAQVNALLGPDNSMAAISSWADDTRVDFPETAPWHYIDIPLDATTIDMASECPQGNCVVAQIKKFEAVLKDSHAKFTDRRTALEFLVHFVGDLHQPLHCADNHDQGGNQVHVTFFGQPSNLHSVWDSGILNHIKPFGNQLAEDLDRRITPGERKLWVRGSVEDWALESHWLARNVAYKELPPGQTPVLGEAYLNASMPVIEAQLEKGGIRLAFLLNQAFH
jgi:nuclease S1